MSSPVVHSCPTVQSCGLLNIAKPPANVAPYSLHSEEDWGAALPPRLLLAAHLFRASQSSRPAVNMAQHNRAQTNKKVTPAARFLGFFFYASAASHRNPSKIFSAASIVTTTIVTVQTECPPGAAAVTGNATRMNFFRVSNVFCCLFFLPVFFLFFIAAVIDGAAASQTCFPNASHSQSIFWFETQVWEKREWGGGVICRLETSVSGFSFCGILIGFTPASPFVGSTRHAVVTVQQQVRSWCLGPRCEMSPPLSFLKIWLNFFFSCL